jgi:FkbM family methyltransferase
MWSYIHTRTVARILARLQKAAPDRTSEVVRFLARAIESQTSFSVLQVGSYDGVSNDPVHDLVERYDHVRAVLLEPQPGPYAALEDLWRDTARVTTLRCALSDTTGERPLYVISDEHRHKHPFPDQVSSFLRAQVEFAFSRYVWRPAADAITSVVVPTVDWPTLLKQHGPFDLVVIDAEGYDAEILQLMDLSMESPGIILYEHRCLSSGSRRRCEQLLSRHGYVVRPVNNADTLATRTAIPGL